MPDFVTPVLDFVEPLARRGVEFGKACGSLPNGFKDCSSLSLAGHTFVCGLAHCAIDRLLEHIDMIVVLRGDISRQLAGPRSASAAPHQLDPEAIWGYADRIGKAADALNLELDRHRVCSQTEISFLDLLSILRATVLPIIESSLALTRPAQPADGDVGDLIKKIGPLVEIAHILERRRDAIDKHFIDGFNYMERGQFSDINDVGSLHDRLRAKVARMARESKVWDEDYLET